MTLTTMMSLRVRLGGRGSLLEASTVSQGVGIAARRSPRPDKSGLAMTLIPFLRFHEKMDQLTSALYSQLLI